MKIAVLGPSNAALMMTRDLLSLGASVRLFWEGVLGGEELLKLHQEGVLINSPWQQVTKRFLLAGQKPADQTRFADLFRVSYLINPEPIIEQSQSSQPEVYEKLTQEFMASLKRQLEMFEDVDVVIDASPCVPRRELGPGGPAIGENRLRPGTVAYGDEQANWSDWAGEAQEIAVIGDGLQAAKIIVGLQKWFQEKKGRIFHISLSPIPFKDFFTEDHGPINNALNDFLITAQAEVKAENEKFLVQLEEWSELDDFVKVKKPKPEQPIPRYVVFSGHVVSAVDQLVDKSRSFLTIETSPFAQGQVQVENNELELKTIGVDRLIGATGTRRPWDKFYSLDLQTHPNGKDALDSMGIHREIGFFTIGHIDSAQKRERMITELKKLFSPRNA
ncbi:MAG: hypothetical protein K2P81_00225 [Bacteriovoracaceae bacterium]|nr:hypothetical protein [Bacteriovoracaceae bacterium]